MIIYVNDDQMIDKISTVHRNKFTEFLLGIGKASMDEIKVEYEEESDSLSVMVKPAFSNPDKNSVHYRYMGIIAAWKYQNEGWI